MIEDFLQQNALWIIKDPWYPHPYRTDSAYCPNINEENSLMVDKIVSFLSKLKHVKVSMALKDGNIVRKVHPKLTHINNIEGVPWRILLIMKQYNLKDIVYCGFHYGKCIIYSTDGARVMSNFFNVYVKKDLCGFFAGKRFTIERADDITRKYATII